MRFIIGIVLCLIAITQPAFALQQLAPAHGPLSVHPINPRYFTDGIRNPDGSLRAVYLTGSHTWNNMADTGQGDTPPAFDFDAYLDFLDRHHHNFIRLWSKEETAWDTRLSPEAVKHRGRHTIAPHPWARTGPDSALDGKPKFDLNTFDPSYFERLRSRVEAAGRRGIYVSVMLFEGYVLQHVANSWSDHPFHEDNNISGIDGDPNGDGLGLETHTLDIQAITHLQEAYIRQVIDTVGDLDNVLYEISNESGAYSTEWQSHMIRFIKEYEARRTKQHPVGITVQWSKNPQHRGRNQSLYDSLADWISPGSNVPDGRQYQSDPPATDGRKVVFLDTDHLWGIGGDANWVWKSFTRGYSPLFMDPYDNSILGETSPADWDTIRMSLGQARRLADRVDLATMVPSEDFVSTKYCLADQDATYIVYLPPTGISRKSMAHSVKDWLLRMFGQLKGEVTVDLTATNGFFQVEWITPIEGTITPDEPVAGGAMRQFTAPFQGSAVLLLSKIQ